MVEAFFQIYEGTRHPSDKVNTDHKYMGIRFYFESDNVWTTKIQR